MEIAKTGFILYTINYESCVTFYKEKLGLEVLYAKDTLTCFEFGGSYLMVEIDDETTDKHVSIPSRDRVCLRLNVPDVKHACKVLDKHNISYSYGEFEWGAIAKFRDPDMNLIGFRSAKEHESDKLT